MSLSVSSVSHVLAELLQQTHINESELARRVNLPKATINRITSGRTPDPRASTLIAIAEYFNISVDQLMGKKPLGSMIKNASQKKGAEITVETELLKEILDKALALKHDAILAKDFSRFLFDIVMDMATLDASIEVKKKMLAIAISSASFFNQEKNGKIA